MLEGEGAVLLYSLSHTISDLIVAYPMRTWLGPAAMYDGRARAASRSSQKDWVSVSRHHRLRVCLYRCECLRVCSYRYEFRGSRSHPAPRPTTSRK